MIFRNIPRRSCRGVFSNRFDPCFDFHRRHRKRLASRRLNARCGAAPLAAPADPDRQTVFLPRSWHNRDVLHGIKFSFERDIFFRPQAPHETDRLVGASRALLS